MVPAMTKNVNMYKNSGCPKGWATSPDPVFGQVPSTFLHHTYFMVYFFYCFLMD